MYHEHARGELKNRPKLKEKLFARLLRTSRIAGIIEGGEDERVQEKEVNEQRRKKSLGRRIVSGALLSVTPIASTFAAGEALDYRPAESAHVNIIPGLPESEAEVSPNYKPNRIFLSVRGFGREVACEMATATHSVTSEYGRAACLVLNPKNLDQEEIVSALEASLLPFVDDNTNELELNIHAQSAGGKMILRSIEKFLKRNPNVHLNILLFDSSPHDKEDVLGGDAKFLVDNPEIARGGMATMVPAQIYSLSKTFAGHSIFNTETWDDAVALSKEQRTSGLRAQAKAIDEPLPDLSAIASQDPHAIYMRPAEPDVDKLVNTSRAYEGWYEEFAKYGINLTGVAVGISSHAPLVRGGQDTEAYIDTLETIYEDQFAN